MSDGNHGTAQPSLSVVDLLPCSIEFDGTAPVNSYFHISHEVDKTLRSHLRGRELKGRQVKLGSSISKDNGLAAADIVINDGTDIVGLCVGDNGDKKWVVEGHFTTMNVWEHDTLPDLSIVDDCLSWFSIAHSVSE